jgi:peroxiredoxin
MVRTNVSPIDLATALLAAASVIFLGCTSQPPPAAPNVITSREPEAPVEATSPPDTTAVPGEAVPSEQPSQSTAENMTHRPPPIELAQRPKDVPAATDAAVQTPQPVDNERGSVASNEPNGPQSRTVFYRADASQPAAIPAVKLSKGHEALCQVKVGDTLPDTELEQLGGGRKRISDLAGRTATVVVFWKAGRRMTDQLLLDLGPDVIDQFSDAGLGVAGVAVGETAANAQGALERASVTFPNLLDSDGSAFTQVGSEKLPRIYLLDPKGKILWFDIEYSLATRRELHQALRAVTAEP